MGIDLIITFCIIGVGVFLFVKDYFSIDTTSIIIMALFIVAGVLNPEEGFSGFNHPATLTLGCIFVVSGGIFNSGALNGLSDYVIKLAKIHYTVALTVFCILTAFFSAFINDTAVVALMLPMALTVCRETNINPQKLLMPISFAALFGGTCTLIGTSTNILISSYTKKFGLEAFGMFEFSAAALCLLLIGFLYLFFIAPILLPKRKEEDNKLTKEVEKYIIEIVVEEGCADINKAIVNSKLVLDYNVNILSITREGELRHDLGPETIILYKDILKVVLPPQKVHKLLGVSGYKVKGSKFLNSTNAKPDNYNIYEVIIPFGSGLAQESLKSIRFNRRYNLSVLAIRKRDEILFDKLSAVKLKEGDMLLVLGQKEEIKNLEAKKLVVTLSEYQKQRVELKKAIPAVLIGIGVVLAASLNLTTILISAMIGALLMIMTKILSPVEAYNAVEWKVIFMMAGVLSMGTALEKVGGDQLIADFIKNSLGQYSPQITLSLLYLVTLISTNLISSKATAALLTPVVISLASIMGISERPFLIAVMFACSLTFMTPMSYPTNTMVYAPGNYRFNDFLRVGTPLNLLIWLAASFVIPYFFPF
ncbi:SLC13 family permease [Flavobacteriaceae bacterium XHP0103]|uniref:SLC13 family permease n=1 Tax=Marixanthotalea marina TaxID=2844359 RepID=UPI002989BEEA|nr:SLC13 family permease [Marixanthotalea marina]MBU3820590.1 SLC13 family permease [Marixanthotalea marina]